MFLICKLFFDFRKGNFSHRSRDGPWPDPTRAYFWPAVNKRPTRLWPGYFPTRPEAIFFDPKEKKLKNLTFLAEISWILNQTINGRPDPSHKKLTRPGSKIFDPDPSLHRSELIGIPLQEGKLKKIMMRNNYKFLCLTK